MPCSEADLALLIWGGLIQKFSCQILGNARLTKNVLNKQISFKQVVMICHEDNDKCLI